MDDLNDRIRILAENLGYEPDDDDIEDIADQVRAGGDRSDEAVKAIIEEVFG